MAVTYIPSSVQVSTWDFFVACDHEVLVEKLSDEWELILLARRQMGFQVWATHCYTRRHLLKDLRRKRTHSRAKGKEKDDNMIMLAV